MGKHEGYINLGTCLGTLMWVEPHGGYFKCYSVVDGTFVGDFPVKDVVVFDIENNPLLDLTVLHTTVRTKKK